MIATRRTFLTGLIAAPVVITTPGLLMPVVPIKGEFEFITWREYTVPEEYFSVKAFQTWEHIIRNHLLGDPSINVSDLCRTISISQD